MSIRYSQDFKDSLVKLHQEGRSLKSLAEEFGPLIMYVNVGIRHAIVVTGYNNGQVNTYDHYNWKFYGSVSSFDAIWNNPSVDYNMDWDAGKTVFAIR